jgi:hypothetical protein
MPNMKADMMKWFIHNEYFTLYNFLVLPKLQMVLLWLPKHSEQWLSPVRTFGKLFPQVQQEHRNADKVHNLIHYR